MCIIVFDFTLCTINLVHLDIMAKESYIGKIRVLLFDLIGQYHLTLYRKPIELFERK